MNTLRFTLLIITIIYASSNIYSQDIDSEFNNENKVRYSINFGYSLNLRYKESNHSENLNAHYKDLRNGINTGLSVIYRLSDKIWLGGVYQLSHTSSNKTYKDNSYGYGNGYSNYGGEYSSYGSGYSSGYNNNSTIDELINISYLAPTLEFNILSLNNQSISIGGGIGFVRYNGMFNQDGYESKTKGNTIGLSPQANYHFFLNQNISIDFQLAIFISYLKKFTTDSNYFGIVDYNKSYVDLYSLNRIDLSIGINLWK